MNERSGSVEVRRRMAGYAVITGCFQGLFGLGVLSTMYGRGPLVLLFLIPMTNIAYPWLMQNAIRVELWPIAIVVGTVIMFLVITAFGEFIARLKMWRGVRS